MLLFFEVVVVQMRVFTYPTFALRVEIEQRTDSPPFVPNRHLTCRHVAFGETGSYARRTSLRTCELAIPDRPPRTSN
jgi:hypothetical protein